MPVFMTQFSYTPEAWANLMKNPEDRAAVVSKMLKKAGGRLIAHHYCFGDYDGFSIYEAPNAGEALACVLAGVARGHIKQSKTTELFDMEEMITALRKAGTIKLKAPKG